MKLTLLATKSEIGEIRSLIFKAAQPLKWQAGQFMKYTIPGTDLDGQKNRRWFTISAAPSEGNVMLTTRFSKIASHFKQTLGSLTVGDEIEAGEPEGDFVVDDVTQNYIFIAGGIGITPLRSILVEAAANAQQLHVHLLYASRDENIAFRDELDALSAKNPHLKISYIIQPNALDEGLLKSALAAETDPVVYVSGPEPMVEALDEQLAKLGVAKDHIKGDYFPGYEAY